MNNGIYNAADLIRAWELEENGSLSPHVKQLAITVTEIMNVAYMQGVRAYMRESACDKEGLNYYD